jgi:hypothetical protein
LHDDFVKHGVQVIEEVREKRPEIYLKVIASILPRDVHIRSESLFEGIPDGQLDQSLVEVRRQLAARAGISDGAGGEAPVSSDKLN